MKKYLLTSILILVWTGLALAQTPIVFLDIPGLNGEYARPIRTKYTAQDPKPLNILLSSYDFSWAAETSFNANGSGGGVAVGRANAIGEMTLNFQIDKSVVGLYERLVNNTKIAEMDIFIDRPAINGNNQTELSRIKMYNITIKELGMTDFEIPQYSMKVRFEKVSIIINTFNGVGVGTKGGMYCFNYLLNNISDCFNF